MSLQFASTDLFGVAAALLALFALHGPAGAGRWAWRFAAWATFFWAGSALAAGDTRGLLIVAGAVPAAFVLVFLTSSKGVTVTKQPPNNHGLSAGTAGATVTPSQSPRPCHPHAPSRR